MKSLVLAPLFAFLSLSLAVALSAQTHIPLKRLMPPAVKPKIPVKTDRIAELLTEYQNARSSYESSRLRPGSIESLLSYATDLGIEQRFSSPAKRLTARLLVSQLITPVVADATHRALTRTQREIARQIQFQLQSLPISPGTTISRAQVRSYLLSKQETLLGSDLLRDAIRVELPQEVINEFIGIEIDRLTALMVEGMREQQYFQRIAEGRFDELEQRLAAIEGNHSADIAEADGEVLTLLRSSHERAEQQNAALAELHALLTADLTPEMQKELLTVASGVLFVRSESLPKPESIGAKSRLTDRERRILTDVASNYNFFQETLPRLATTAGRLASILCATGSCNDAARGLANVAQSGTHVAQAFKEFRAKELLLSGTSLVLAGIALAQSASPDPDHMMLERMVATLDEIRQLQYETLRRLQEIDERLSIIEDQLWVLQAKADKIYELVFAALESTSGLTDCRVLATELERERSLGPYHDAIRRVLESTPKTSVEECYAGLKRTFGDIAAEENPLLMVGGNTSETKEALRFSGALGIIFEYFPTLKDYKSETITFPFDTWERRTPIPLPQDRLRDRWRNLVSSQVLEWSLRDGAKLLKATMAKPAAKSPVFEELATKPLSSSKVAEYVTLLLTLDDLFLLAGTPDKQSAFIDPAYIAGHKPFANDRAERASLFLVNAWKLVNTAIAQRRILSGLTAALAIDSAFLRDNHRYYPNGNPGGYNEELNSLTVKYSPVQEVLWHEPELAKNLALLAELLFMYPEYHSDLADLGFPPSPDPSEQQRLVDRIRASDFAAQPGERSFRDRAPDAKVRCISECGDQCPGNAVYYHYRADEWLLPRWEKAIATHSLMTAVPFYPACTPEGAVRLMRTPGIQGAVGEFRLVPTIPLKDVSPDHPHIRSPLQRSDIPMLIDLREQIEDRLELWRAMDGVPPDAADLITALVGDR